MSNKSVHPPFCQNRSVKVPKRVGQGSIAGMFHGLASHAWAFGMQESMQEFSSCRCQGSTWRVPTIMDEWGSHTMRVAWVAATNNTPVSMGRSQAIQSQKALADFRKH